jgi:hypothetical protein
MLAFRMRHNPVVAAMLFVPKLNLEIGIVTDREILLVAVVTSFS